MSKMGHHKVRNEKGTDYERLRNSKATINIEFHLSMLQRFTPNAISGHKVSYEVCNFPLLRGVTFHYSEPPPCTQPATITFKINEYSKPINLKGEEEGEEEEDKRVKVQGQIGFQV